MSATPGSPPVTELANGRYTLGRRLGGGGFAEVWQATDHALGVSRAIKLLSAETHTRRSVRRRLRAEARAMARIDHPNVLRIYDIGSWNDRDFIVMDLAEGGSLADRLAEGPLPPAQACAWMIQVLAALGAAHDVGVIHRDVKLSNVLLDVEGTALLADFGVALLDEEGMRSTRSGMALGTYAYMAPEQRIDARSVDATADLYAVGASLFSLVGGGTPVDLFAAADDSPRWEGVPLALRDVIRKATRYAPSERYPNALAMAQALLDVVDEIEVTTTPSGPMRTGTPIATAPSRMATQAAVTMLATPVPRARRDAPSFDDLGDETSPVPTSGRTVAPASRTELAPWVAAAGGFFGATGVLLGVWWWLDRPIAPTPPPVVIASALPTPTPVEVAEVPQPPATPAEAPSVLAGTWSGAWEGDPAATVALSGPDNALAAEIAWTDRWRSGERRAAEARLAGRYDPARRRLELAGDGTTVSLTLSDDGGRLTGVATTGPRAARLKLTRR